MSGEAAYVVASSLIGGGVAGQAVKKVSLIMPKVDVDLPENHRNNRDLEERERSEGTGDGDFIIDPQEMKKYIIVPEDGFQAFLERKYIEIRKLGLEDIGTVAKNTGLTEEQVLNMKKHLFLELKKISIGGKPYEKLYFQADPEIAYAWQKAQKGELKDKEKEWFKKLADHETTEQELMNGGMPLRDQSSWNPVSEVYDINPSKNAHDKANLTAPNPIDPFPGYDSGSDFIKHMDEDIDY